MKRTLAVIILTLAATTVWAGTLTFWGTITDVQIVGNEFGWVETKPGDSFFGTLQFNKDLIPISADVVVEGAVQSWNVPEHWGSYFDNFSLNPFSLGFIAGNTDGYSGTDASAWVYPDGTFKAYTVDGMYWGSETPQFVLAFGILTGSTVSTPETGASLLLLALALVPVLFATPLRRDKTKDVPRRFGVGTCRVWDGK